MPKVNKHMKLLDKHPMATEKEKSLMFFDTIDNFKASGWEHIGIDHFVQASDPLVQALSDGSIKRSFT